MIEGMSDGKWRGTDKPGGARFYAPVPIWESGVNCPWPGCYGSLYSMERDAKTLVCRRAKCDECGHIYSAQILLDIHKIDLRKFKL